MLYEHKPSHKETNPVQPSNFVVFGEIGAGKSSLINLIAGKKLAESSRDAQSCTLESTKYEINLADPQLHVNLWDTAGLNEPSLDDSSYLDALVKAHKLIVSLKEAGGLHGLLYCIRGARITSPIENNYRLFHEFLCQSKVPVTLVITHLENEEGDMDDWWTRNQRHIEKEREISSIQQVCITTTMGYRDGMKTRYLESREKMLKTLSELGREKSHPVDVRNWFMRICQMLWKFSRSWLRHNSESGPSRKKMKKMLTERCKLPKEDAAEFLQRINVDTKTAR